MLKGNSRRKNKILVYFFMVTRYLSNVEEIVLCKVLVTLSFCK